MFEKIYVVTDLGPGDGGKGGVVHKIVNTFHARAVLKFGGGQGSHGVATNEGEHFAFSHWGCATLEGIPTVIAPSFMVIPHAILNEGEELRKMGIYDPYALLKVTSNVLCATPVTQGRFAVAGTFTKRSSAWNGRNWRRCGLSSLAKNSLFGSGCGYG